MTGFYTKSSVNYENYNKAILRDILWRNVMSFLSFDWMIKKAHFYYMQLKMWRQIGDSIYLSGKFKLYRQI